MTFKGFLDLLLVIVEINADEIFKFYINLFDILLSNLHSIFQLLNSFLMILNVTCILSDIFGVFLHLAHHISYSFLAVLYSLFAFLHCFITIVDTLFDIAKIINDPLKTSREPIRWVGQRRNRTQVEWAIQPDALWVHFIRFEFKL